MKLLVPHVDGTPGKWTFLSNLLVHSTYSEDGSDGVRVISNILGVFGDPR